MDLHLWYFILLADIRQLNIIDFFLLPVNYPLISDEDIKRKKACQKKKKILLADQYWARVKDANFQFSNVELQRIYEYIQMLCFLIFGNIM